MLLKYKDFKQMSEADMKQVQGGRMYTCTVSKRAGAPASCNSYIYSSNCTLSLSQCCGAADTLANSDPQCFVQGSGNCYAME